MLFRKVAGSCAWFDQKGILEIKVEFNQQCLGLKVYCIFRTFFTILVTSLILPDHFYLMRKVAARALTATSIIIGIVDVGARENFCN